MTVTPWLTVKRGDAPLLVSVPHTGIDLAGLEPRLVSPWLGRRDCDWWIDKLYDFAGSLGASAISVITPFFGSSGLISPVAMPVSTSYWPTPGNE